MLQDDLVQDLDSNLIYSTRSSVPSNMTFEKVSCLVYALGNKCDQWNNKSSRQTRKTNNIKNLLLYRILTIICAQLIVLSQRGIQGQRENDWVFTLKRYSGIHNRIVSDFETNLNNIALPGNYSFDENIIISIPNLLKRNVQDSKSTNNIYHQKTMHICVPASTCSTGGLLKITISLTHGFLK